MDDSDLPFNKLRKQRRERLLGKLLRQVDFVLKRFGVEGDFAKVSDEELPKGDVRVGDLRNLKHAIDDFLKG